MTLSRSLPRLTRPAPSGDRPDDLGRLARLGWAGLALLALIMVLLAAKTLIAGAVIASGEIVVHGKPKQVQTLDGGVIADIHVAEGDQVAAGAPLLRLDPTLLTANLDIARSRLAAALTLKLRLEAERAGQPDIVFDYPDLPVRMPDTAAHEAGQRQIFTARQAVLEGRQARLAETLRQFDNQIAGVEGQIAARQEERRLLDEEIETLRQLSDRGLARTSQMSALRRSRASLTGSLAGLGADAARLANARRDAEIETLQAERAFMEEVVTELRKATETVEELTLEIVTRRAQLDRIDIRAPVAGTVHNMQITTVGGVIAPGETILEVVPQGGGLDFELQVDPRAIDQVHPGQSAQLVLAAFDPQEVPRIAGTVTSVSPDTVEDARTGQSFFRVAVAVSGDELERLDTLALVPGMPVEAYLETGDRSILAYLLHPVSRHMRRAFRE